MNKQLITKKESTRYPGLFVRKYTRRVFYDNLWHKDPMLIESRGHVEDVNGNIVIRPFTKIYNFGENNTSIDRDEICLAVEKVNGFMAAATYVPSVNEVVISTTGSLDSDFVTMASEYINDHVRKEIYEAYVRRGVASTWLFEICHPDDPHIITEEFGAYLIGVRDVGDDSPYFSTPKKEKEMWSIATKLFNVKKADWFVDTFENIKKQAKECKHEGFVVYGQDSKTALKIKSPYYLTLKLFARKKDIEKLDKQKVDEEFYDLLDFISNNRVKFNLMTEQERITFMVDFIGGFYDN